LITVTPWHKGLHKSCVVAFDVALRKLYVKAISTGGGRVKREKKKKSLG
jgi:hypothetical protein